MTKQANDFLAKVYAAYMPCMCVVNASRYHSQEGINCDLEVAKATFDSLNRSDSQCVGVTYEYGIDGLRVKNVFNEIYTVWTDFVHFENCKLILYPLSATSPEDVVALIKIGDKGAVYTKGNGHVAVIDSYKAIINAVDGKLYIGAERYSGDRYCGYEPLPMIPSLLNPEQIDYCRAHSIDVGYANIPSLIDAGFAELNSSNPPNGAGATTPQ